MAKKHNLQQLQQWAREWRMGKWFNVNDVDEDSPNHKKSNRPVPKKPVTRTQSNHKSR